MSAQPDHPCPPRRWTAASACCARRWGRLIAAALEDPDVVEVMLNPDRLTVGGSAFSRAAHRWAWSCPPADGERIIRLVAAHVGAEVHRASRC
jgi:Flp pilus assembly CpaF family ATPase